ncbi:hypothetical protein QF011_003606, partial [Curtobacterium flaccumfaciens]|nr:hypothetical protein [Curtobacterium flaccumfaciens]MDQ0541028.1 hypothetical protein [Curtobacterium flaccumfaciens]
PARGPRCPALPSEADLAAALATETNTLES